MPSKGGGVGHWPPTQNPIECTLVQFSDAASLRWHSKKAAAAAAATPGDLSNVLDKSVSLGIVELLLHPSDSYSDEHNAFIKSIPPHVKELVRCTFIANCTKSATLVDHSSVPNR